MTTNTTNTTMSTQTPAICERNVKRLALVEPNLVLHFVRTSARLYGRLALREQFNLELVEGFTSYSMVELDHEELCELIAKDAKNAAKTLCRMNVHSIKRGYGPVLRRVEELGLSEIVESINSFLEKLVEESDFRDWLDELAGYIRPCDV